MLIALQARKSSANRVGVGCSKFKMSDTGNPIQDQIVQPLQDFGAASADLIKACNKPDMAEFQKVALAAGTGFLVMGAIGFVVKLFSIPINSMLLGK